MIKKLLIANRGEVAVRIIRACAEAGITSVAIYTDTDRHALHVHKADEAYNIGPQTVAGYLNAHRIVNLAVATHCDALHPGYGFLSENPLLAEICKRRGVRYVGPNAAVIRKMGDKIEARSAMQAAGLVLDTGGFSTVVLDLHPHAAQQKSKTRIPDHAWMQLRRLAASSQAVFLVVSSYSVVGPFASLCVSVSHRRSHWQGLGATRWLQGLDLDFEVLRKRHDLRE